MGLDIRLHNITAANPFTLSYKTGATLNNTLIGFTSYSVGSDLSGGRYYTSTTGVTSGTLRNYNTHPIIFTGASFDTQYWFKMTDSVNSGYTIGDILTHECCYYPCGCCGTLEVQLECLTPTPTPTPTVTSTPTVTPTPTPTGSPTPTPTPTGSPTPTPTATPTPTEITPTPTPTVTSNITLYSDTSSSEACKMSSGTGQPIPTFTYGGTTTLCDCTSLSGANIATYLTITGITYYISDGTNSRPFTKTGSTFNPTIIPTGSCSVCPAPTPTPTATPIPTETPTPTPTPICYQCSIDFTTYNTLGECEAGCTGGSCSEVVCP